jgi:hypothetical protein
MTDECIVTNNLKTIDNICSVAMIKKYFDVNEIFTISKNDELTKQWIESSYNKIYLVDFPSVFNSNTIVLPSILEAIDLVKQKCPYLIGERYLLNDTKNNYLVNNIMKRLDYNVCVSLMERMLDSYLIDKRKIRPIMKLNDTNLMNICFQNGSDLCYVLDDKKQFIITLNRFSDLEFDYSIYNELKNIVPDQKYINFSKKIISYGTNKYTLPNDVLEKCDYDELDIRRIIEKWYLSNKTK